MLFTFHLLSLLVPLLIGIAFLTLLERRFIGLIQERLGPNTVGVSGLIQPFADAAKLLVKETLLPDRGNLFLFILSPILSLGLALVVWSVVPFGEGFVWIDLPLGILCVMALSSLAVYGVLWSGWSSNSKYAILGSLRSGAQIVSYEVSLGLLLIIIAMVSSSYNWTSIVLSQSSVWFLFPLFPLSLIFFISTLAESNRNPFDLPEGESELVSGYNVEYSSLSFALFFLAEYLHIIFLSWLTVLLFLGGWLPFPFFDFFSLPDPFQSFCLPLKVLFLLWAFVWVRASFPRIRYDQLILLVWKSYLPLVLGLVLFVPVLLNLTCWE